MTTVHTYEPLSEVVRGENVRVGPSVEILWSWPITDPFTVQITCSAITTSLMNSENSHKSDSVQFQLPVECY